MIGINLPSVFLCFYTTPQLPKEISSSICYKFSFLVKNQDFTDIVSLSVPIFETKLQFLKKNLVLSTKVYIFAISKFHTEWQGQYLETIFNICFYSFK